MMLPRSEYRKADMLLRPRRKALRKHYRTGRAVLVDGKKCRNMAHAATVCNCHRSMITLILNRPGGGYVKGHHVRFANHEDEPKVCPCCGQTIR